MTQRTCREASAGTGVLPTLTAPLSPAASAALARLELAFDTPMDRLRRQIARLVDSLRIQREGRDSDVVQMRNPMLSELERAAAEGSFRGTVREIRDLQWQLREAKALLAAASDYRTAEARANALIRSAQAAPMSDLDADDLAHNVDLMAGYKATLADAGRLDLIGGA